MFPRPMHLVGLAGDAVVDQPGDGEALAFSQDHFGLGAALRDGGNQEALQRHGIGVIERAHFGRDLQIDGAGRGHGGGKVQAARRTA